MPGAMRKLGLYLGLVEEDEDRERDEHYDEYEEAAAPVGARRYAGPEASSRPVSVRRFSSDPTPGGSIAVSHAAVRPAVRTDDATYRITTLQPHTYNEARTLGEHFREGSPVILNLTEMDDSDAKRLIDFAAGLVFALRGTIERVTAKVFLLSPQNIDVTAEDRARIAEGGFFNQS